MTPNHTKEFLYLACSWVIVNSVVEILIALLGEHSPPVFILPIRKPGSFGCGKIFSLLNKKITDAMFGLLSGCNCTHRRPT